MKKCCIKYWKKTYTKLIERYKGLRELVEYYKCLKCNNKWSNKSMSCRESYNENIKYMSCHNQFHYHKCKICKKIIHLYCFIGDIWNLSRNLGYGSTCNSCWDNLKTKKPKTISSIGVCLNEM